MPRRNVNARMRFRGQAKKGRHKLDPVQVVEDMDDDDGRRVPGTAGAPRRPADRDAA